MSNFDQTFDQFLSNIPDQAVEVSDKSNTYQCMDLAYLWVFVLGYPKSTIQHLYAYQVFTVPNLSTREYFDIIANTPDFVPQKGDLAVFGTDVGVAGHIAVCTGVGDLNSFQSVDQNWNGVQRAIKVTHKYGGNNYFLGVLRPKKVMSSGCLLPMTEENQRLFDKLVHNSDLADGTVRLLELSDKADNIGLDTIQKSLSARDGKLTSCTNTLATRDTELAKANQEVSNRVEQIGRVQQQLTNSEIEKNDLQIKIKDTQIKYEAELSNAMSVSQQLQSKLDEEAKAKGRALNDLAVANARIKTLESGIDNDDRATVYKLLRKLLERIVGN